MAMPLQIGIDVGSVSVNTWVADAGGNLLKEGYHRTNGLPFHTALRALEEIMHSRPDAAIVRMGITGSGGRDLARLTGGLFVNEIVAQSRAVIQEIPDCRTVIEMGGEDSKLLQFTSENGRMALKDFSMNTLCAAGTGSFLDQQAARLGVSIEKEFGEMALKCQTPPRVAGRCSVFAKSDMIHLQQVGTPVHDIIGGLCHALARNFKASIGKGKTLEKPIAFQGGVAANRGMIHAFEKVLELTPGELIIPPHYASMGALGALLTAIEQDAGKDFKGLDALKSHISRAYHSETTLTPLKPSLTSAGTPQSVIHRPDRHDTHPPDAYLGIDVGSISTNVVVIDAEHRVLAKRYLPTASRPIEAIARGLDEISAELGDSVCIRAAGTTGSGRYLSGDLVGADVVVNEITAQATAAIDMDPEVDTIFEIGGQDSKYISIDNGAIVDFEMNKVCAAGTGSFLEEQAERLGVNLKMEFTPLALDARSPVPLGDRCTVFMETDLVHHQQAGADKGDLLAGLAYSTVYNYLNRVVTDKRIGRKIFFQGGTAFNKSVVAAFNSVLGREVIVPPHHDVTGAIGVAIIAHLRQGERPTRFKGFDLSSRKFDLETFECKACSNHCEIHSIKARGEKPLFYGSRCDKFDVDHVRTRKNNLPDLFAEREERLFACLNSGSPASPRGSVGIPLTAVFWEQLPFWTAFFQSLGFTVIPSGKTSKPIISRGVEMVASETCFPVKVAHGHMLDLFDKAPDFIFLPSLINAPVFGAGPKDKSCYNCPYIQSLPYTLAAALDFHKRSTPVFSPVLHMQNGSGHVIRELCRHAGFLRSSEKQIAQAVEQAYRAQDEFSRFLTDRGHEILDNLDARTKMIVIVGRPYNSCDSGMNLDLPRKLLGMDTLPVPMDMLPLDEVQPGPEWKSMYWHYGQRIMRAARFIREHQHIYALYVTNFGCGPDSFLLKFFARELCDKPFLQIEIDEHSADAGAITRCEAYLDTITSYNGSMPRMAKGGPVLALGLQNHKSTMFIPNMCNHAFVLESVARSLGMEARVMDPPDEESISLGRKYTTGKECYPALLTTGDMIRESRRSGFDPGRSAFFMPSASGPCRFGQYAQLHRHVLDSLGYQNVPIITLDQDVDYHKDVQALNSASQRLIWQGFTAVDTLERLRLSTRPYEKTKGDTDALFMQALDTLRARLLRRENPAPVISQFAPRFRALNSHQKGTKPLIGIVGEIYIRSNPPGNEHIIEALEALGVETALAPISEWMDYATLMRRRRNVVMGNYISAARDYLIEHTMHWIDRRMADRGGLQREAHAAALLEMASPYLHDSFTGEAVLSIGKTLEFIRHSGAGGVINVMPFTCMPGTIVTAILKRIQEDCDSFPCISLAFTGQQSLNLQLRLEAFVYQVTENWKTRRANA